ncbi:MAG: DUF2304 domain-containing protein [Bacteroidota bacterium]
MELRFFQIIVPLIALYFIANLIFNFRKSQITIAEMIIGNIFWVAALIFALFPDHISTKIALVFGIESNVNAIIFFCIGLLFLNQFKMYFLIRKQEKSLTILTRKLALKNYSEEGNS